MRSIVPFSVYRKLLESLNEDESYRTLVQGFYNIANQNPMIGLEFLDMNGVIGENPYSLLRHINFKEDNVYQQVLSLVPQCKEQIKFNETSMKALTETLIQESKDYPTMLATVESIAEYS
jgi:hypothetical protein